MAFPTNFSANGLTGVGGVSAGVTQGLYEVSTVEQGAIGSVLIDTSDGSEYVYAYFNGACTVGRLAAMDASAAIQTSFDAAFTNSAGAAKDDYAVGDTLIFVQSSDITSDDVANQWAGGYLFITDAAGEGHKYKIASHAAGGTTETNTVGLNLFPPGLALALDSESSAAMIGHAYNNLAIANAGTDDPLRGVTMVDVAAGEYAWVQRKGMALIEADEATGTIAAGSIAVLADGTDGAVAVLGQGRVNSEEELDEVTTEPIVGEFLMAAVDTEFVPVDLKLP
jgi:hypothetical protein